MPNLIEIVVTAVDKTKAGIDSAKKNSATFSDVVQKAGVASGLALIAVGAKSTEMATQFQSSTTRLATSAGESYSALSKVGTGMLNMAGQVGIGAKQLSDGMYTVESAGYHGADGLKVLKAAAEGAKDENADLGTVSNAVTDVLVDYHQKASSAADVTSKLVTAVSYGKTSFQDLSASMHSVLPLASAMHLNLSDVLGVLSQMTAHGVSADQATQNMANTMRHLAAPTNTMKAAFANLGITTEQVQKSLSTNGLAGTLQFLSQTAQKAGKEGTPQYTAALAKLLGSAQGLNVALMTTGENSKNTQAAIAGIGKASADSQGQVAGFAETQKTLKQQEDELSASVGSLMVELGQKLLPVLTTVTGFLAAHGKTVQIVAEAVGVLLASLASFALVMKTVAMVTKLWTAAQWLLDASLAANPIGIVVIAIAALVAGLIYAYKHSETFRNIVNGAFNAVKNSGIELWHGLEAAFHGIVRAAQVAGSAIAAPFRAAFNGIRSAWNATVGGRGFSVPGWVPGIGGDSFRIPYMAHGGVGSGLTLLGEHGPELANLGTGRVYSNPDTSRMLGGGGGTTSVTARFDKAGLTGLAAAMIETLRLEIQAKGGNVQTVLGS